ncbi:MAG: fructokinase [Actinobacteria bacterium 13_1_20CM_3_68_10]|nr:MAG: fructokinase [Actinobacteria bacterium 13_1_20CM_3_68_10]
MVIYGGIEAGGSKWVCATGTGPDDLEQTLTFATTDPEETIARAAEFFSRNGAIAAIGIGSFGPIDIDRTSPTWGRITTTPKPGWAYTEVVAALRNALDLPIAFDTDVNAAALGEHRWGAAVGLETFCYITVGTGIGGGGIANGNLMHGLLHPEFGHMRIPHDRNRDPFDGACPYHGDCFEGLASGDALRARWGRSAEEIADESAWLLEAEYLALGLQNVICTISPQKIILGGGVMKEPALLPHVRSRVQALASGYFDAPELGAAIDEYIVPPALGDRAGVLGALELARRAVLTRAP